MCEPMLPVAPVNSTTVGRVAWSVLVDFGGSPRAYLSINESISSARTPDAFSEAGLSGPTSDETNSAKDSMVE